MIRRLFTMMVFSGTVTLAVFGQNVFGREHIIAWAHQVQAEGPKHVEAAWDETDKVLAQLVPQAGGLESQECFLSDDPQWAAHLQEFQG
jgi:hypothetical protein